MDFLSIAFIVLHLFCGLCACISFGRENWAGWPGKLSRLWFFWHDPQFNSELSPQETNKSATRRRVLLSFTVPAILLHWRGYDLKSLPLMGHIFADIKSHDMWVIYGVLLVYFIVRWGVDTLDVLMRCFVSYAGIEVNMGIDANYYHPFRPEGDADGPGPDNEEAVHLWQSRASKWATVAAILQRYYLWVGFLWVPGLAATTAIIVTYQHIFSDTSP